MGSNLKNVALVFSLATIVAGSEISSCNVRPSPDKKDNFQTKELLGKYNEGKEIFNTHCNTCHIAPDKKASDQQLFYNLFGKQSSDYVIKYISDSRKLKLSGDKYSNALDQAYKSDYEHFFKNTLSALDFDNLIIYLKVATHEHQRD